MFDNADQVVETHISWVYLEGDCAYKRKKGLRTAFLDYSTPEARRRACEEEVRVNRRLAPDVYLGVKQIPGPDWVVKMRRMPAERRLARLVMAGAPIGDSLRDVARRVAALHLRCGRAAWSDGVATAGAALRRWEANHEELAPLAGLLAHPELAERAVSLARRYVAGREALFAARIQAGRAVDGHGDLVADDIFLLPDGARILDALEFDPALRAGDGLADIAFLAMDLERLGAPQAARQLLAWYAEFTSDRWPQSLADFHIAYRAQVRAKVACLRAAQASVAAAPDADALLRLAVDHLEAGRVTLVVVGGPPATGKSTLAAAVGAAKGWVVLRSDQVRRQLAGIPDGESAAAPLMSGVYAPSMTALTYGALLRRAALLLEHGEGVVLDATWADPVWRRECRRVADRCAAELVELQCQVPIDVAEARAGGRPNGDSDAGPEVARALAERFVPWPEATVIATDGPAAVSAERAVQAIDGAMDTATDRLETSHA